MTKGLSRTTPENSYSQSVVQFLAMYLNVSCMHLRITAYHCDICTLLAISQNISMHLPTKMFLECFLSARFSLFIRSRHLSKKGRQYRYLPNNFLVFRNTYFWDHLWRAAPEKLIMVTSVNLFWKIFSH